MSYIIRPDFKNKRYSKKAKATKSNKIVKVESQVSLMLEMTTLFCIHFWANEAKANKKLTFKQCREFGIKIRDLRIKINSLIYDNTSQDALTEKFLDCIKKTEFKEIIDWFRDLGIPFTQSNVIQIDQFLQSKQKMA